MTPQQFKAWRQKLEYTQSKAAEKLGVTRQQISNYERGHKDKGQTSVVIPRYIELACMALAHGLDEDAAQH